jgi:hypothetical protein
MMLYPLHETMDLPASPLYNLLYALLVGIFGRIGSIFAMKYMLTVAVAGTLFILLVRLTSDRALSFLLGVLWVVTTANLSTTLLVYHFALWLFLLAVCLGNRNPLASLLLLALCTMTRPKYLLPLIVYGLYLSLRLFRGTLPRRSIRPIRSGRAAVLAALFVVVTYTALRVDGWNLGGRRTWHAFGQHYALAEREAGRTTVNPWIDYNVILRQDFGDSASTLEAIRANP